MGGLFPTSAGGSAYIPATTTSGGQYPNTGQGGGLSTAPAATSVPASPFRAPATISPSSIPNPTSVAPSPGAAGKPTGLAAYLQAAANPGSLGLTADQAAALAQALHWGAQTGNLGNASPTVQSSPALTGLVGTNQPTSSGAPGTSALGQATTNVNQMQSGLQSVQQQQQALAQSILNPTQVQQVINALTGLTSQAQQGQQALQSLAGNVSQQLQTPLTQTPGFQQSANRALDQLRGSENAVMNQGLQQLAAMGILRGGAPLALTRNIAQDTASKAAGLLGNLTASANQQYPQQLLQALGALAQGYQIPFGMNQSALQGAMNFLGLGNNLLGGAAGTASNLLGGATSQFNTLAQVQEALQAALAQQKVLQQELPLIQQSLSAGSMFDPNMLTGMMNYLSPVGTGAGG